MHNLEQGARVEENEREAKKEETLKKKTVEEHGKDRTRTPAAGKMEQAQGRQQKEHIVIAVTDIPRVEPGWRNLQQKKQNATPLKGAYLFVWHDVAFGLLPVGNR